MEEIVLQNVQKELAATEMQTAVARQEHQIIIARLMTGPGDSDGAMHRAERMFGLPYWSQFNLRHKCKATYPFIAAVNNAYVAMLEKSVRRDVEALKIERAKTDDDADLARLVAEAETLLAEIEKRRARK